jgi:hypothetical protein
MTMQPSRPCPTAIRYIVHNFLLKQESKRPAQRSVKRGKQGK